MILESGDMWQIFNRTDLFCITTNSTIKKDGSLVMGRGIALQAKNKLPGIDSLLGSVVNTFGNRYGFQGVWYPNNKCWIGLFQVKYHWRDKANIELIEFSTMKLKEWSEKNSHTRVDLNFPGIGYGHLSESEVMPVIASLPDCVHVWRFE